MNPTILKIDGWMDEPDMQWLHDTAKQVPVGGIIVEIGAWKGRSSAVLYAGAGKNKSVISIDTWKGEPHLLETIYTEVKTTDMFSVYMGNMKKVGFEPKLYSPGQLGPQYLIADSVESAEMFDNHSVHLVFIDGDHQNCGQDIDAWTPKVRQDGLISGHDYFCYFEWIQQEIHKRFYIQEIIKSIWVRYVGVSCPDWYSCDNSPPEKGSSAKKG